MLCHRSDLGYFARIQEGISGTAKGGTDVESDHELPRGASVDGVCHVHGGSEGKATEGVRTYPGFVLPSPSDSKWQKGRELFRGRDNPPPLPLATVRQGQAVLYGGAAR